MGKVDLPTSSSCWLGQKTSKCTRDSTAMCAQCTSTPTKTEKASVWCHKRGCVHLMCTQLTNTCEWNGTFECGRCQDAVHQGSRSKGKCPHHRGDCLEALQTYRQVQKFMPASASWETHRQNLWHQIENLGRGNRSSRRKPKRVPSDFKTGSVWLHSNRSPHGKRSQASDGGNNNKISAEQGRCYST